MKLHKLNQKGIAHLLPIVIAIVVLLVGFAAYRVINKNKETPKTNATQQSQGVKPKAQEESEKTVYNFENSPLQIDLLEGWNVNVEKRFDQTGDNVKEGYNGKITGPDGWGISFALDQGGFGGGPGCNYKNEEPDMPKCPYYKVVSRDKLQTEDYLYHLSLSRPGGIEDLPTNCVIVLSDEDFNKDLKTGKVFEATGWVCFANIGIKGSEANENIPANGRFAVIFPKGLDQTTSTAYRTDAGFNEAMEILGSLNYR